MKLCFRILWIVILFFGFSLIPARADRICTANPDGRFTANRNPIASFGGGCSNPFPGCSCTTSTPNCRLTINVTPRDASGTPTNTQDQEGVTWSCTPGFEITDQTVGDRCFQPRGRYTGTGPASCTITAANGVHETFRFGSGTSSGPSNPNNPPLSGDPPENDTMCAYTQGTSKICVPGTEGFSQNECTANQTCVANRGCTVTNRSDCRDPQPSISTAPLNDPPPTDLGQLIKRIFDFSLTIVGLTVFVMVIYGGFLMLLAGGLPSMHAQGRKYITNAFLGALLLFAAYVILNTINPNLVRQRGALPPLPTQQAAPTPRP